MKTACPVASYAAIFNEKALGLIYAELLLGPDYLAVPSQLDPGNSKQLDSVATYNQL